MKEIEMLPYHTVFVLQQERLARYQAEAQRATARRSGSVLDTLSRAAARAKENLTNRTELRPAV